MTNFVCHVGFLDDAGWLLRAYARPWLCDNGSEYRGISVTKDIGREFGPLVIAILLAVMVDVPLACVSAKEGDYAATAVAVIMAIASVVWARRWGQLCDPPAVFRMPQQHRDLRVLAATAPESVRSFVDPVEGGRPAVPHQPGQRST